MKKLLVLVFALTCTLAQANPYHHGYRPHHHHGGSGWGWVAPALIGGLVVYGATRPAVAAPPPPTVVYTTPVGMPTPPYGYHYEQVNDAACNCLRWVIAPNVIQ